MKWTFLFPSRLEEKNRRAGLPVFIGKASQGQKRERLETRLGAEHWKPCSLPFGNFSSSL